MFQNNEKITRRDFIKTGAMLTGSMFLPYNLFSAPSSPVIEVYSKNVTSGKRINRRVCKAMLEQGIKRLTGVNDAAQGLKKVFRGISTDKKISIKINTINSSCSTHPESVYALCDIITSMQIGGKNFPANNITIWDREEGELRDAGYKINTGSSGVKVIASDTSGYGFSGTYNICDSTQKLATLLTSHTDYLVNFAVLKNHALAGVTLTMKNHYGSVSSAWRLHGGSCTNYLVALNSLDAVKKIPTLFLVDSIFGVSRGGPGGYPDFKYNSILLSTDTVAIDKRGYDIIKTRNSYINNTEFMKKSNGLIGNMKYNLKKITV